MIYSLWFVNMAILWSNSDEGNFYLQKRSLQGKFLPEIQTVEKISLQCTTGSWKTSLRINSPHKISRRYNSYEINLDGVMLPVCQKYAWVKPNPNMNFNPSILISQPISLVCIELFFFQEWFPGLVIRLSWFASLINFCFYILRKTSCPGRKHENPGPRIQHGI